MLIFEKDIHLSPDDLCNFMTKFSTKINKNYIYGLLSEPENNIVLYSFDSSTSDVYNCPCSLIYNKQVIDNEIRIYIMFIATKYKFRKLGYANIFIKEFIDFIKNKYSYLNNKISIILDSVVEAVTFYEHIGFKWTITDKYNDIFEIEEGADYEHFIMVYGL